MKQMLHNHNRKIEGALRDRRASRANVHDVQAYSLKIETALQRIERAAKLLKIEAGLEQMERTLNEAILYRNMRPQLRLSVKRPAG
jgi:hypothetical protein